jgi:hypothetical protein
MDSSHMVILLVVLLAIYSQEADVTLKPGTIMELYGNEGTSSSRGDVDRYVINRELLESIFNTLPVYSYICRW